VTPTCTSDGCIRGETPRPFVKCDQAPVIPFGLIAVQSESVDFTTVVNVNDLCARAIMDFRYNRILPSGAPEALFAPLLNAGEGRDTEMQFAQRFVLWQLAVRFHERMINLTQLGNATDPSTNCYKPFNGYSLLLSSDAAIYPCVGNAAFGADAAPFVQFSNVDALGFLCASPSSATPTESEIASAAAAFYSKIAEFYLCWKVRAQKWGINVAQTPATIAVPANVYHEFIRAFLVGRLTFNRVNFMTADQAGQIENTLASGVINILGDAVNVIADQTLTTTANTLVGAPANSVLADMQIHPAGVTQVGDASWFEFYGYDADGANSNTNVLEVENVEGRRLGRFRVTKVETGACISWAIEARPRLRLNIPPLFGKLRNLCFKSISCSL
jgi:hypothetical protein